MTVRELLDRADSYELAEWRAFERALGPVGREYENGALALIHEQLQSIAWVVGAQYGDENPAAKPEHFPRPNEMFLPQQDEPETREYVGGADELSAYFDNMK